MNDYDLPSFDSIDPDGKCVGCEKTAQYRIIIGDVNCVVCRGCAAPLAMQFVYTLMTEDNDPINPEDLARHLSSNVEFSRDLRLNDAKCVGCEKTAQYRIIIGDVNCEVCRGCATTLGKVIVWTLIEEGDNT